MRDMYNQTVHQYEVLIIIYQSHTWHAEFPRRHYHIHFFRIQANQQYITTLCSRMETLPPFPWPQLRFMIIITVQKVLETSSLLCLYSYLQKQLFSASWPFWHTEYKLGCIYVKLCWLVGMVIKVSVASKGLCVRLHSTYAEIPLSNSYICPLLCACLSHNPAPCIIICV